MKTPRELLLQRHAPAEAKLDAVRAEVIASLGGVGSAPAPTSPARVKPRPPALSWWLVAWRELFWSCRRAWLGVGAVWAVLFLVNLTVDDAPGASRTLALAPSPETRRRLREQFLLRAELMGTTLAPPPEPRVLAPPRPRSERRQKEMLA